MSERVELAVPHLSSDYLEPAFASSLFGYLYFQFNILNYKVNTSEHFKEVMGRAVLRIQRDTHNFNRNVLDCCGYAVDKLTLCEKICTSYPDDTDYFKKLYYVSAFILDTILWWHKKLDATNLTMGPNLWLTVFQNNFKKEFEIRGGWRALAEAGNECCQLLPGQILPIERLLPAYFETVIELIPKAEDDVDMDEALEELENLNLGREEVDLVSGDEAAQVEKSDEEIEENRPEEVAGRPSPKPSAIGGNLVQVENPCEGTSGKSGAVGVLGSRNLRKRRRDTPPPKNDSDPEGDSLSPCKAKVDRR